MMGCNSVLRLSELAIHLTGIAIRQAALDLLRSPRGRRAAEPNPKGARERLSRTEAHRECDMQDGCTRLRRKAHGRDFDPSSPQIVAKCLAHPRGKESMKVERGKMGHFGQGVQVKRLIQVLVDVFEHSVHPSCVLGTAAGRCGAVEAARAHSCCGLCTTAKDRPQGTGCCASSETACAVSSPGRARRRVGAGSPGFPARWSGSFKSGSSVGPRREARDAPPANRRCQSTVRGIMSGGTDAKRMTRKPGVESNRWAYAMCFASRDEQSILGPPPDGRAPMTCQPRPERAMLTPGECHGHV